MLCHVTEVFDVYKRQKLQSIQRIGAGKSTGQKGISRIGCDTQEVYIAGRGEDELTDYLCFSISA